MFHAHRLAGPAARNKGMALFPRKVGGKYLALCRSDGERTSVASSADGYVWDSPVLVQEPSAPWEMLQVGNCGPPIETERGWLVLTHGVGPMRVYVMGTMLLDLDDPTRVVGYSRTPLLSPGAGRAATATSPTWSTRAGPSCTTAWCGSPTASMTAGSGWPTPRSASCWPA